MFEKIKNSSSVFWTISTLSILLTAPITLITIYEYINVAILKNIGGYPFGQEGPVAGIEYYQSADSYAKHMLISGLIWLILFGLTLYLVIKRKTVGILILGAILIVWTYYDLVTNISNLD
jgi:hypothetical protein